MKAVGTLRLASQQIFLEHLLCARHQTLEHRVDTAHKASSLRSTQSGWEESC